MQVTMQEFIGKFNLFQWDLLQGKCERIAAPTPHLNHREIQKNISNS